ncbi:MAG TPA: hypothetical protein ENJ45_05495, partial [Phaeodactylibacter sp.]|nr:hypothetical protein [Phaeodactylibacter sp.]
PLLVKKTRKALPFSDYEDVENNMPRFIEYMFEEYAGSRFHFTWSQWVQSFFENENVVLVKYEDLLKDAKAELKKTIRFLEKELPLDECLTEIVQRFSFENMTKRLPGEENRNSFLRKGIAGDWKNYFSQKAIDIFGEYAGRELEGLGYR